MMAKFLLPLLFIAAAAAFDEPTELCNQLTTQFNYLQGLVPLEVDISLPHTASPGFITGHAKFRIVSPLNAVSSGCYSVLSADKLSKRETIQVMTEKAFVISPTQVLLLNNLVFTLTLDVKEFGSEKTVTVSDFTFTYQIMFYETTPVPTTYRNYLYESIQKSLKRELEQKLNYTFDLDKRVEINPKMVKELMQTVFQVTAQDF